MEQFYIIYRKLNYQMELSFDTVKESENLIKKLLVNIEEATESMNQSFEDTILRHEEQFIKCYRLKIYEIIKLFQQLKTTIQDKFINNTLAVQLETVLKERDYFKYQCLKLNSQHQTLLDDHKNITAQSNNASEQISIYKHLLQTQKIRTNQMEQSVDRLKKNLNQIAAKHIPETRNNQDHRTFEADREVAKMKREVREKNQIIRALKERVIQLQRAANMEIESRIQKKQLYELFRVCVQGWKRQLLLKGKKQQKKILNIEQLSSASKKQLLRILFTHNQFLKFIERLLFQDDFKVIFESTEENYMQRNRAKLFNYMNKRRIYTAPKNIRI